MDKTISDLSDGGAIQNSDEFIIARAGGNVKILGDKFNSEALWDRVTGTPNYLLPQTASDDIGATGARITKGWFTDLESTNMPTVNGTSINANGVLDLTSAEIIQLSNIDSVTISNTQWGQLGGDGFALLAGRSGGQTLIGGTDSGDNLTLQSTSNATKGQIISNGATISNLVYIDEANDEIGFGTNNPVAFVEIFKDSSVPLVCTRSSSSTSSILRALELYRETTGTAEAGIGAELAFRVQDAGGSIETAATIAGYLNDVPPSGEEGSLRIELASDSSLFTAMTMIASTGDVVNFTLNGGVSITTGTFALPSGTTVNEIVTSISGGSTDDQLPTAKAVWDAIGTVDTWQEVMDNGNIYTIADNDNKSVTINQNDVTNNPAALIITNTGTGNDITLPNSTYIKNGDMVLGNDLGLTGSRVNKGWFTDIESTNMPTVGGTSINANGILSLTSAEVTQLANIDSVTISNAQWGYLGALNQGVATSDSVSFADIQIDNININGNTISDTSVSLLDLTSSSSTIRISTEISLRPNTYVEIGTGAAGIDYSLRFNGETNDGIIQWMEDEDYFKIPDDIGANTDRVPLGYFTTLHGGNIYMTSDTIQAANELYVIYDDDCYFQGTTSFAVEVSSGGLSIAGSGSTAQLFTTGGNIIINTNTSGSIFLNPSTSLVINNNANDVDTNIKGDTDANLVYVDAGNDRVGIGTATPQTKLDVNGGVSLNTTTVNAATYDLLISDYVLNVTYTGTGAVTSLTLPTAQTTNGRIVIIKDAGGNAGTNNITIDTEGSETIDGAATAVINGDYDAIKLYCDGSNWFII